MAHPLEVLFFTKPGCHLCETAATDLHEIARHFDLHVVEVDITRDQTAYDRWWADIPVVQIGATVLRAPFTRGQLHQALHQAADSLNIGQS
jgi:hypothetical protein